MNHKARGNILLLITAMIWGCAFVAQSVAMDSIGAWTFTCLRSLIAGIALLPLVMVNKKRKQKEAFQENKKELLKYGFYCGLILAAATMFQQKGIVSTTVGKCGFITSLYVVIVPVFETLRGKRFSKTLWIAVVLAVVGLYFLSLSSGSFEISNGDLLVLVSSFLFATHIIVIDHATKRVDPISMSCIQFMIAGLLCIIPMFVFEKVDLQAIKAAAWPLFYAGVISSGVGYTLQIVGQKDADPALASMLLSLESVFSAIAGFLFLNQKLSPREILGCVIVFVAIILAQMSEKGKATILEE